MAITYRSLRRACLVVLVVSGLAVPWAVRAEVIEQILVKVNGEIFTKTDLETRQVAALRQMGQNVEKLSSATDAQLRQMLDQVTPQLIVGVVDEMIVVQRGRELGYRLADDQFQSIIDSIKKDNKIESDEQFQAALKDENLTMADLRRNLERQMIYSRVQQNEVLGRISVSDEEARRYYESHASEFTSPQSITLREVLVSVPSDASATVAQDSAAREKAASIRARALNGESFEKLAADMSDSPSRANAGLIGPLSLTDLSPELRTRVESMKVGDLTELLRTPRGYQILKLETKTTADVMPFDKAREEISNKVFATKRTAEFQKYLDRVRAESIVEWKNADLKKAYDLGLNQAKTSADAATPSAPQAR